MKSRVLLSLTLILGVLLSVTSCADIDELSDENAVTSFEIVSHHPKEIELADAWIDNTEDIIYIPIMYGVDKFPLNIRANVEYASKIDQIVGADLTDDLMLESIDDRVSFTVVAISGMPRKYTIVPVQMNYEAPEEIPVTVGTMSVPGAIVYKNARIENGVMVIYVVNAAFPMVMYPEFSPGEGVSVVDFENGVTPLSFLNATTLESITLANSEGAKRDIPVRVQPVRMGSGETGGAESLLYAIPDVTPSLSAGSVQEGLKLEGYRIDQVGDEIKIFVSVGQVQDPVFPLSVDIALGDLGPNVAYMGIDFPLTVTFDGFDDEMEFLAFDLGVNTSRRWKFSLGEYVAKTESAPANITSFTYGYTPTNVGFMGIGNYYAITMDTSVVQIDPIKAEIYLKMTGHRNPSTGRTWAVTLDDVAITVSEGATFEILQALEYSGPDSWKEDVKIIRVIPEYGEPRDWRIVIKDWRNYTVSSACDVETVTVESIYPLMVTTDHSGAVEIDSENKTVKINITQDEGCYPMTVDLDYKISDYASLSVAEGVNLSRLVFDLDADTGLPNAYSFTITAEDGVTSADWAIELNRPVETSEANITGFVINSVSPSKFVVPSGEITIDGEKAEVLIPLSQSGACPVTINYTMSISRNAIIGDGVQAQGSHTFTSLAKPWKLSIMGRDGNVKEWTVRFADWAPQLQNQNFDGAWSGDCPAPAGSSASPYWATANNSYASTPGTSQTAGNGGGSAVRLYSQMVEVLIVKQFAAGSLFLGWFDSSNASRYGLSDPVILTFQGIEFSATRKLVAFDIDINYTSGGGTDSGSAAIELIKHDPEKGDYVYHGKRPTGVAHPNNTATYIGRGQQVIGNSALSGVTKVIPAGQWETVRVNIDYGSNDPYDYSHLLIICSSSSKGDSFVGEVGSTMLVDNIRLVYEGDE